MNMTQKITVVWKGDLATFYLGDPNLIGGEAEYVGGCHKIHLPAFAQAVNKAIHQCK